MSNHNLLGGLGFRNKCWLIRLIKDKSFSKPENWGPNEEAKFWQLKIICLQEGVQSVKIAL